MNTLLLRRRALMNSKKEIILQSYKPLEAGYNPAVCIILEQAGYGSYVNSADKTKGWYLTKKQAEDITTIGTIFKQKTNVTDTNGICGTVGTSYTFTNFIEFEYFIGVTQLENYVFKDCNSLTEIVIPNTVTVFFDSVFEGCYNLIGITIPNSVTKIGQYSFNYCTSLTEISFPSSVVTVGGNIISNCTNLRTVYDDTMIICWGSNLSNVHVVIGNSVTKLKKGEWGAAITNITIPNNVTSSNYGALLNCTGLTYVTIPNSVTSLADDTFKGCTGLTEMVIPSSITSIGGYAFYNCTGLEHFISLPTIPPSINTNGFPADIPIYVPWSPDHSILNAYKTTGNWASLASRIFELNEDGEIPE